MKKLSMLALALVAIAIAAFTVPPTGGYKVGDVATDFKLKNVNGKTVSLKDYTDAKGFIVIFTCNHCPYAKAYEQRIMDLDKNFRAKGFPVIAISSNDATVIPDDSYDNMVTRAKGKGYTFPYLYDETQTVARKFGATRTPNVFVLNKTSKGNIVEYMGSIDDNAED